MKKEIPIITAFILLSLSVSAYAFDPLDLAKLKKTKFCPACDLSGADLSRMNLRDAYLSGSNLKGANLSKARLRWAYLGNANMENANLKDADLRNAVLSWSNLEGADFTGAKIKGAYFVGAIWTDGTRCDFTSKGRCDRCLNWSIKDSKCLDAK